MFLFTAQNYGGMLCRDSQKAEKMLYRPLFYHKIAFVYTRFGKMSSRDGKKYVLLCLYILRHGRTEGRSRHKHQPDMEERNETIEMMKTRRSVRKFKSDPVPPEIIDRIVEAGTFAASGHDRQPWAIITVTDKDVRDRLSVANAAFFDMPVKDPFYGAPAIIIVLAKTFTPTYVYDGALAVGNMMLAAHALGVSSCWIHRAKQVFALPEWQEWLRGIGVEGDYEGIGHIALGYSDGPEPEARPRKAGRVFRVE